MSQKVIKLILGLMVAPILSSCGVKGDPLPPEEMPKLGRGHPTYQRASEQITPRQINKGEKKEDTQGDKK